MNRDAYRDMILTGLMQAKLAHAVYVPGQVAELAHQVDAKYREFAAGYIAGAALIFGDHVHISITGTNDTHDWVQNLSARQRDVNGYRVHSGFVHSASRIMEQIRLHHLPLYTRSVYLGGHSAGGAIAQVLAQHYRPKRLVTFGAPRVFDPESAVRFAANEWPHDRYVRTGDPVPQLPLRTHHLMFGGAAYRHAVGPMHLTRDGLRTDESSGVIASAKRAAGNALAWARACLPWTARAQSRHSMSGYLESMTQLAAEVER